MKKLLLIPLALSASLVQARCCHCEYRKAVRAQRAERIKHDTYNAVAQAPERIGELAHNVKVGAQNTAYAVSHEIQHVAHTIAKSKPVQVIKEKGAQAGRATKQAAVKVKDTAVRVGHVTKDAAISTGKAIKNTAFKIGRATKEGAYEIKEGVQEATENA